MSLLPRPRWFGTSLLILFVAGIGFFVLSVLALGVLPGRRLERSIREHAPLTQAAFTPAEAAGRFTYATEGCAYCHTEQVRSTPEDVRRWGPPTTPWETKFESPQLWGTRRIGPDLAREAGVRSDDWQLAHLYNPRLLVPDSVMPGYPWLFDGGPGRPTEVAQNLLAYLKTLGRARIDAGTTLHDAPDEVMPGMATDSPGLLDNNPARAHVMPPATLDAAAVSAPGSSARGATLFGQYCAACHGAHADGASAAAAALQPRPANLTAFRYSDRAFATILHEGVAGSSMPAWRDLTAQQVADLAAYVGSLHATTLPVAASDSETARGAELYAQNCTACHGVRGNGDGAAAIALLPRPFDFRHVQPAPQEIDRVLREGVPGSAMPAFPGLNAADRQALVAYLATLAATPAPANPEAAAVATPPVSSAQQQAAPAARAIQ